MNRKPILLRAEGSPQAFTGLIGAQHADAAAIGSPTARAVAAQQLEALQRMALEQTLAGRHRDRELL